MLAGKPKSLKTGSPGVVNGSMAIMNTMNVSMATTRRSVRAIGRCAINKATIAPMSATNSPRWISSETPRTVGASASATLVTGSFIIDQGDPTTIADDYMEFTVQLALPMKFDNATCNTAYGNALNLAGQTPGGRFTETINLKYSFQRASTPTYKPFPIADFKKLGV